MNPNSLIKNHKNNQKNIYKLKLIFLIFFGLNTLNFPYISEELTDKYHLRKSILACNGRFLNPNLHSQSSEHLNTKSSYFENVI